MTYKTQSFGLPNGDVAVKKIPYEDYGCGIMQTGAAEFYFNGEQVEFWIIDEDYNVTVKKYQNN